MENYVKVLLYAYPMLKTIEKEYAVHISNRAILSYRSRKSTEQTVEYIAKEIICKQRLEWLRSLIDKVMEKLNEEEKALVVIRYFCPCKNRKMGAMQKENATIYQEVATWSDGKYFRRQKKVAEKICGLLENMGFSKELYERDFAFIDVLQSITRFVERGGDSRWNEKERQNL